MKLRKTEIIVKLKKKAHIDRARCVEKALSGTRSQFYPRLYLEDSVFSSDKQKYHLFYTTGVTTFTLITTQKSISSGF